MPDLRVAEAAIWRATRLAGAGAARCDRRGRLLADGAPQGSRPAARPGMAIVPARADGRSTAPLTVGV